MHYYSFHIGDYRAATAHLTNEEDLAYRRLLDWYYDTETPISLADTDRIARRLRVDVVVMERVLQDMFCIDADGNYRNFRADVELTSYHEKLQQASNAGKASAQRRLNARSTPVQQTSNDSTTDVQPTNNHKPITINQEPKKIATVVACPSEMDESIWEDWMAIRKKKKAPLTETAWKMFINEVESAGWTIDKAIKECCLRNWQSFKAEWVEKKTTTFAQVKADVAKVTVVDSADYEATKRREAAEDLIPKHGPSLETLAKMAAIRAKARA